MIERDGAAISASHAFNTIRNNNSNEKKKDAR